MTKKQIVQLLYLTVALFTPLFVGVLRSVLVIGQTMIQAPLSGPAAPEPSTSPLLPEAFNVVFVSGVTSGVGETLFSSGGLLQTGLPTLVVSSDGQPAPLTGGVGILPQYSAEQLVRFLEIDRDSKKASLSFSRPIRHLVIPSIVNPEDLRVIEALKRLIPLTQTVVSQGEGARLLAHSGLLNGRSFTTHFIAKEAIVSENPASHFKDEPWHKDSTQEPTLLSTQGGATALQVFTLAPHSSPPVLSPPNLSFADYLTLFLTTGFSWTTTHVGVLLFDGVDDATVGALLDFLPRTFTIRTFTVGLDGHPVKTSSGVRLQPTFALKNADRPDILVIPSSPTAHRALFEKTIRPLLEQYSKDQNVRVRDFGTATSHSSSSLETVLRWIADPELNSKDRVSIISKLVRAPELGFKSTPVLINSRWIGVFLSSLAGIFVVWLIRFFLKREGTKSAA